MFKIAFVTLAFALLSPSLVIAQEGFLDESFALGSGDGPYYTRNFNFVAGGSTSDTAKAIARSTDGYLTAVGYFFRPAPTNPFGNSNADCGVMRLLPDGAEFDTSFAPPNGFRTLALDLGGDNLDFCNDVVVLADGSTWIAGSSRVSQTSSAVVNTGFVIRLLPNGDVDSNFFADGVFLLNDDLPPGVSLSSGVTDLYVDRSGRLLVTGTISRGVAPDTSFRGVVLRFLADGTLDPDFAAGGYAELADFNPPKVSARRLAQDSQGRLLAFGSTASAFPSSTVAVIFRLLDSGAQDTSFGTDMTPLGGGGRGFVQRCAVFPTALLDSSDRILADCLTPAPPAPAPFPQAQLIRLLPNGLTDLNFGSAGVTPIAFEYNTAGTVIGNSPNIAQILTQADNKILVTGYHEAAVAADWGTFDIGVLRLLPNGNPDPSFGQNRGASLFRFPGRSHRQEFSHDALLEPNGRMVIVGSLSRAPVSGGSNLTDFLVMAVRTATPSLPDAVFANEFE